MATVEISVEDLDFFEYVGGGSFGSVYRGFWKSHEQIVAIKKHTAPDSSKEVAVLSKLSHRNIIQLYGAVTVPPHLCFVTEYASGGSLYHYLSQNNLEFPQILTWARHIALGMNYLHNEAPFPVIHRDLKSKNVVLTEDLTAKICDFGCARFMKNTTKMSLAGTFPWMAPEAIQQLPSIDVKSDVFSYGVVVWELLTSEVPFKGLEGIQVAWLVVAHKERLTIPASCPERIASLMKSCWQEVPKHRPDFREVLAALQLMSEDADLPDETHTFLKSRDTWRAEISATLEDLKKIERNLNTREKDLLEREMKLEEREKQFHLALHEKPPDYHDVAGWAEKDVSQWINYIAADGGREDLCVYGDIFQQNHINGKRLLQLGSDELKILVPSIGHQLEIQAAIDRLKEHNERLLNFPPLGPGPAPPRRRSNEVESQVINLTLIFGNHFKKGALPDLRKWKMYMMYDGDKQAIMCIKCVHFIFAGDDSVTINQPMYVMDEWRSAEKDSETVECVVEYDTCVKRPRKTTCTLHLDFTGTECVHTTQQSVLLTLKKSLSRAISSTQNSCKTVTPHGSTADSSQPDSGCCNTSGASSQSSINSDRSQQRFEALPGLPPRKRSGWPANRSSLTPERVNTSGAATARSLSNPNTSPQAVISPSSVGFNNPWFTKENHLHWGSSQAKTVRAQGPTIQAAPARRSLDFSSAHFPPPGQPARPAPSRQSMGTRQPFQIQRPGPSQPSRGRPAGDTQTLPAPQAPRVSSNYRRSVSDISPQESASRVTFVAGLPLDETNRARRQDASQRPGQPIGTRSQNHQQQRRSSGGQTDQSYRSPGSRRQQQPASAAQGSESPGQTSTGSGTPRSSQGRRRRGNR